LSFSVLPILPLNSNSWACTDKPTTTTAAHIRGTANVSFFSMTYTSSFGTMLLVPQTDKPCTQIDNIETYWIMSICDFLRMEFTEHSHPVALCEGDEFIMVALRIRGQCTARDMQRLNACRMHLRFSRLSEIATAEGTRLRPDVLKGKDSEIHPSEARWPRQAQPLASDWQFWSKTLRAVFSKDALSPPLIVWVSGSQIRVRSTRVEDSSVS
jgi:hypothetical protein